MNELGTWQEKIIVESELNPMIEFIKRKTAGAYVCCQTEELIDNTKREY